MGYGLSIRRIKRRKVYSDAKKKAEIDAAWEEHNTALYAYRREWLEKHLILQNGLCAYCTIPISASSSAVAADRRATIDHIVPLSRGGADARENTLAACAYCNMTKGNLSVEEFRNDVKLVHRLEVALVAPGRLCVDPTSAHYDLRAISRGVVVRFNGKSKGGVYEYSVAENWIRVKAGRTRDKRGRPVTVKISGVVQPYYKDTALLLSEAKRRQKRSY